uniref:Uncharacterized protein n=1 Tax=Ditylenchus dipsaci TaxID=166011 RepID=A0A915D4F4_9BILA
MEASKNCRCLQYFVGLMKTRMQCASEREKDIPSVLEANNQIELRAKDWKRLVDSPLNCFSSLNQRTLKRFL